MEYKIAKDALLENKWLLIEENRRLFKFKFVKKNTFVILKLSLFDKKLVVESICYSDENGSNFYDNNSEIEQFFLGKKKFPIIEFEKFYDKVI
ncbi:MAG: hypothetical protein ABIP51_05180 [Bacteroidia bacterium]